MVSFIIFIVAILFFVWVAIVLGLLIWGALALRGVVGNHDSDDRTQRGYHAAPNRCMRRAV